MAWQKLCETMQLLTVPFTLFSTSKLTHCFQLASLQNSLPQSIMMAYTSIRLFSLLAIILLPVTVSASPTPQPITASSLPLSFTPVFTANLILGKPSNPIPIPGGILINEPITGGTVSGYAITERSSLDSLIHQSTRLARSR